MPLEYVEVPAVGITQLITPAVESAAEQASPAMTGVPEEEVERRLQEAREAAALVVESRLTHEFEVRERAERVRMVAALTAFEKEKARYFERVEAEIVQLSLAIARKILQREAEIDPTLVCGLVRIALGRMQSGSSVRVRVPPAETQRWLELAADVDGGLRWETVATPELKAGDCILETEMGQANFGLEAQQREIEESVLQLLAHRPARG